MRRLMNITGYSDDVERYESAEDLEDFLRKYGLDGVELLDSVASTFTNPSAVHFIAN